MCQRVFKYRIDNNDTIVDVSDNWASFADENGRKGALQRDNVVGRSLWDFIQGIETQYLYQELFRRARSGTPLRTLPFRCDSPDERRFLELEIKALPDGQIEITSTILRTESRASIHLLDAEVPRTQTLVTVCSMCKKIKIAAEKWCELEEGLACLGIFEDDMVPQLTHGLCPSCYRTVMEEEL